MEFLADLNYQLEQTISVPGIYLHGKLQEIYKNTDLVRINSYSFQNLNERAKFGIFNECIDLIDLIRYTENPDDIDARLFVWKSNDKLRGLIVDSHDKDAMKYAKTMFCNQSVII